MGGDGAVTKPAKFGYHLRVENGAIPGKAGLRKGILESVMNVGAVPGAQLTLAVELVVLYAAGSYAMGRLMSFTARGGVVGRSAFYLLVFPGVVLHEGAHYLACLITGTEVVRFVPFSPQRSADGRIVLGYVRHERRALPIRAIIGLAPVLSNPLGILFATALLTPLTFRQAADPSVGIVVREIFAGGFLTDAPLLAAAWAYLSLSFALGSVPSREDLPGLPLLVLVLGGGILLAGSLGTGAGGDMFSAAYDLTALAARIYALPAAMATGGAVAMGLVAR
jgi:hypothetical protein